MLVFWNQRLVVLAMPKTGSTALAAALRPHAALLITQPPRLKHMSLARFNRTLRPMLEETAGARFTTLCLVRDPRDWLGSWWRYRRRPGVELGPRSTAEVGFDQFVRDWCAPKRPPHADVDTQAGMLEPGPGQPAIDRLFRYDDQGAFLAHLEDALGLAIRLPQMNVSPVLATDLTDDTAAMLERAAAADFHLYRTLSPPG